ncbi:MAG: hypothetical protein P8Z00_04545 [Anaerolineales bacterium]|jgi:hypothetical protein
MMYKNSKHTESREDHHTDKWDEGYRHTPHRNFTDQTEHEEVDPNYRTLRRRGDAKPPRMENVPIGMARCQECGALVPRSRLEEHIEKSHREQDDLGLENCPYCNAKVRADRLEKHIQKVHPDE